MLKKSYRIIQIFAENPTKSYLFSEIKKKICSKSESYTYNSINSFVKEGILIKEQKGNLMFYKISNTYPAISFLSLVKEYVSWDNKKLPLDIIFDLIQKVKINFFTLLITGSYVNGKQSSKSDLDVILIVPIDTKKVMARLKHFCDMSIPKIHLYVFTDDEFKQMLLGDKHNYGKEIVKNNLIFCGAETYYNVLFEVMKHGFSY